MSIECCFVGRIGQEPSELKQSKAGKPWASFTIAVGGEGEGKEDTALVRRGALGPASEFLLESPPPLGIGFTGAVQTSSVAASARAVSSKTTS
jgi:hypothetical protein